MKIYGTEPEQVIHALDEGAPGVEGLDTIVGTPARGWPRLQEMGIVVGSRCNRGTGKVEFRGLCSRDCTCTHPRGRFFAIAARGASPRKIFSAIAGNFRIFAGVWQQV